MTLKKLDQKGVKMFHDFRMRNELNLFEYLQVGVIEITDIANRKIYASGRNRRFTTHGQTTHYYGSYNVNGNTVYFSMPIIKN